MLEGLSRKRSLAPALTPRSRFCAALGSATECRALKLSRSAARAFLSTVERIAKHSCDRTLSTKKMHLKTVCLFLRAHFCVDAADIWFRIWIGSFSHGPA